MLAGRLIGLFADLGVAIITLVKLYSDSQIPSSALDSASQRVDNREITFTFLSCALSVASFIVSIEHRGPGGAAADPHGRPEVNRGPAFIISASTEICCRGTHASLHPWSFRVI